MNQYGDNFVLVVPEEHPLHTQEQPFCGDPTCICYKDQQNISELTQAIKDGLITSDDATQIIKGKTV